MLTDRLPLQGECPGTSDLELLIHFTHRVALLTSLTGDLAASFPSTVPASVALLVVVVLVLMRSLNVLLHSALRCCQESGRLIKSVFFFQRVFGTHKSH